MARSSNPLGNLPAKAARQWESVYESAKGRGISSSAAAAQAWCAVKRRYYKKGGRWLKRKRPLAPDEQPPGCTPSRAYRNNPSGGISVAEAQALYRGVDDLGVPGQRDVIFVDEYAEPRSADGIGDVLRFEKHGKPFYWWVYPLPSHDYVVRKVEPPGSSSQDWQMTPLELHEFIDVMWAAQEGRRPYVEVLRSARGESPTTRRKSDLQGKNPTMARKKMTKRDFEAMFKEDAIPMIIEHYEQDGIPDKPARREAWNNTVDAYISDGLLPESAENWSHPRWLETYGHRGRNPRSPNAYLGDAVERAKQKKYGYPPPPDRGKGKRKKSDADIRKIKRRVLK